MIRQVFSQFDLKLAVPQVEINDDRCRDQDAG
jgi:hypothetical protein